jgi:hypothetical protein
MQAYQATRDLEKGLITVREALDQTGAGNMNELYRLAEVEQRRELKAA